MVAFITSLVVTGLMIAIAVLVARRRPPGTPVTWGEALLGATFAFALLLMCYGIVPDRWLRWADNELRWRSDKFGIPVGGIAFGSHHLFKKPYLMFPKGLPLLHGHFVITAQAVRDVVAALIYGVFIGGQLYAWSWWQRRGRAKAPVPELPTSAYGRPLMRKV
jgi:hypothetical protein